MESEELLPDRILARATLRGREYAWKIGDIAHVIEAAEAAQLASIGGQLQFRLPDGGTCECYWVEVDTYREVPEDLEWPERVSRTAEAARSQFMRLREERDFIAEGRSAFASHLEAFEAQGGDVNDALCFVWYVESESEAADRRK